MISQTRYKIYDKEREKWVDSGDYAVLSNGNILDISNTWESYDNGDRFVVVKSAGRGDYNGKEIFE
jgi:hypothetical protein